MMPKKLERVISLFLTLIIIVIVVNGLSLTYEDKADSPLKEYIIENHEETGAVNLVEAVLLDFRAYDTFGEVIILYIAIAGVIILGKEMRKDKTKDEQDQEEPIEDSKEPKEEKT